MSRRTLFFLSLLFVALLGILLSSRFLNGRPSGPLPDAKAAHPGAFLNSRWGMSASQVQEANRLPLRPSVFGSRFYRAAPSAESRVRTFEAGGQKFLGRPAVVNYTFLDDRLFTFHVFTSGSDADALDADMRGYLIRAFGTRFNSVDDESSLKMVWHFKDKLVNYWFYEEELALSVKFKAGFGVVYKPMEPAEPAEH